MKLVCINHVSFGIYETGVSMNHPLSLYLYCIGNLSTTSSEDRVRQSGQKVIYVPLMSLMSLRFCLLI